MIIRGEKKKNETENDTKKCTGGVIQQYSIVLNNSENRKSIFKSEEFQTFFDA